MDGIKNQKTLNTVKNCEFDRPLIHNVDSISDNCFIDCHISLFHEYK